jgi:phage tail sheath gpL-like
MSALIQNPKVSFNLITRDQTIGLADQRTLFIGQRTASAIMQAGLNTDLPRTETELNELLGPNSHAAMVARSFRAVNQVTNLDVILLDDAATAAKASATAMFAGVASRDATVYMTIASGSRHRHPISVAAGDTPVQVLAQLASALSADTAKPFTVDLGSGAALSCTVLAGVIDTVSVVSGGTGYFGTETVHVGGPGTGGIIALTVVGGVVTGASITAGGTGYTTAPVLTLSGPAKFTAANGGTHANDWPLVIEGYIPGMTVTLTAFTGGSVNPTLTGLFAPVQNIRYQTVIYPSAFDPAVLKAFIEPRKNIDNAIMDGVGVIWSNAAFATVKAEAATLNSSEIVLMTNAPNSSATWKGPYLSEAPDCLSANFVAALARRFETDVGISDIVANNEPRDQFGGVHTASLPLFNTPFLGVRAPKIGSGYSGPEQLALEQGGVSVVGTSSGSNVVAGVVVTTWLKDAAGNPDTTWSALEHRLTHPRTLCRQLPEGILAAPAHGRHGPSWPCHRQCGLDPVVLDPVA